MCTWYPCSVISVHGDGKEGRNAFSSFLEATKTGRHQRIKEKRRTRQTERSASSPRRVLNIRVLPLRGRARAS